MTSKNITFIGVIVVFVSCYTNDKNNGVIKSYDTLENASVKSFDFQYLHFRYQTNQDIITYRFPFDFISETNEDTLFYFKYIIDKSTYVPNSSPDTIEYFIRPNRGMKSQRVINSDISENLEIVNDRKYSINEMQFHVYKLKTELNGYIDQGREYIWIPEYGIISEKSIHWLHFSKMEIISDSNKRENLRLLFDLVYNDIDNTFIMKR